MATYTQGCSQVGSFSYAKYFTLYVVLTDRDGKSETNKSQVDYNVYCQSSGSGSISANHDLYFSLNGNEIRKENVYVNVKSPKALIQIASGTLEVEHDNDGSKKIPFSASIKATGGYGVSASLSDNFTLTTIPRASSIACTTANIEETAIITISSASSNFRHDVIAYFGNLSVEVSSKVAGGTIAWTIPKEFYTQIPNAKSGVGTIKCNTYNGDELIGSKSFTLTVTTNEEKCKPSLNATVVDYRDKTIALTNDNSKLIKYESTAKISITASAKNSASISSKKVNNTIITENSILMQKVETDTFIVTVTDSRGYSNSVTLKPTVINYIPLSINATIKRTQPTTGEVDIVFSGNYYNDGFGSINNELHIDWKYREKNKDEWIDGGSIIPIINNDTYSNGGTAISLGKIFDYKKAYEFMLVVSDKLTLLQPTFLNSVPKGIPIFNWGEDYLNVNGNITIYDVPIGGITLYEDETGIDTGSFTIDENNCQTFKFYAGDVLVGECKKDSAYAHLNYINQGAENLYVYACRLIKSDNTFTFYSNKRNLISNAGVSQDETDIIKITKIIGY